MTKVIATRDFCVGPSREIAIDKGSIFEVAIKGNNSFFIRFEDGGWFGSCRIGDGWEVYDPQKHLRLMPLWEEVEIAYSIYRWEVEKAIEANEGSKGLTFNVEPESLVVADKKWRNKFWRLFFAEVNRNIEPCPKRFYLRKNGKACRFGF